jgi:hypothetical protein
MEPINEISFKHETSAVPVIESTQLDLIIQRGARYNVSFRYYRTQGQGSQVGIGFPTWFAGLAAKSENAMKAKMANFFMMFCRPFPAVKW